MVNKRWSLPTQKGTEAFPRVTIPPPKLVIAGFHPDTPEWRVVADHFGGQLKAFHGRAQQNYSLSPIENTKFRKEIPGARMSYQNLQGQETLHLEVDNAVFEAIKKKVDESPWDYVLIEFAVHNKLGITTPFILGYMTSPLEAVVQPDSFDPTKGVNFTGAFLRPPKSEFNDPIFNAPILDVNSTGLGETRSLPPDNDWWGSLTVDLRPMHPSRGAIIDFYGNFLFVEGTPRRQYIVVAYNYNYEKVVVYRDFDHNWYVSPALPPEWTAYGTLQAAYLNSYPHVEVANIFDYTASGHPNYYQLVGGTTTAPKTMLCELQVTFFKGIPKLVTAGFFDNFSSYYRWYPAVGDAPIRKPITTITLLAEVFFPFKSMYNHYGLPKLGTLTLDGLLGAASFG